MHQNKIWIGVLAVIAAIALWFGGKACYEVYDYMRVDQATQGNVTSWSVERVGSDKYILRAAYGFRVGEKLYEGESAVPKLVFLNEVAARRKIDQLSEANWTVWYAAKDPICSRLGKNFPYKQCVYALILGGVLVYFIILGQMASRSGTADLVFPDSLPNKRPGAG